MATGAFRSAVYPRRPRGCLERRQRREDLDLTLSNGTEIGPGRHRVVLRALSADRSQVLDVSDPVRYTIPRSFAKAPVRCGVA